MSNVKRPLVTIPDLQHIAVLSLASVSAFILPSRFWHPWCLAIAVIMIKFRRQILALGAVRLEKVLGTDNDKIAEKIVTRSLSLQIEARVQYLRHYLPVKWHPQITVVGKQNIKAALSRGRGVILWVNLSNCSSLITKMALHQLGYDLIHLSRPGHGTGSISQIGIGLLNPIFTRVELRYLRERVILDDRSSKPALAKLRNALANNEVISITVGDAGARTTTVPFLQGQLRVATGVPHLAFTSGASLLPVFSIQTGCSRFEVRIGEQLKIMKSEEQGKEYDGAILELANSLGKILCEDPAQFYSLMSGATQSMLIL